MLLVYDGMAKFNYVNKDHKRRTYTDTLPFFAWAQPEGITLCR